MRFQDKVAVVTGGSRGIGRAIATRLGIEGSRVVVNFFSHASEADEVVNAIHQAGGEALTYQADVSDREQAEALIQYISKAILPFSLIF